MAIRVAASCRAVLQEANRLFPNRSKASDGTVGDARHRTSESDHNPTAEGWVTAVDLTHDPVHGCDAHQWARDVANRRDPRVKYLISEGQICSSYAARGFLPWRWRPYPGANRHDRHAHLSVLDTPTARNDTSSWFRVAPVLCQGRVSPDGPDIMEDAVRNYIAVPAPNPLDSKGDGWYDLPFRYEDVLGISTVPPQPEGDADIKAPIVTGWRNHGGRPRVPTDSGDAGAQYAFRVLSAGPPVDTPGWTVASG